jgi:hypothetical protein
VEARYDPLVLRLREASRPEREQPPAAGAYLEKVRLHAYRVTDGDVATLQLARTYTEAWCSRDPDRVAAHYVPGGTIAINGGDAAGIADVAEAFISAFPDIEVFMDDLVLREDGIIEYRWTFTGTSAETGRGVRVPGFEEWTISRTA